MCAVCSFDAVGENRCHRYVGSIYKTENLPWPGYEEDGHQRDGFMVFCMRLAEYKTQ